MNLPSSGGRCARGMNWRVLYGRSFSAGMDWARWAEPEGNSAGAIGMLAGYTERRWTPSLAAAAKRARQSVRRDERSRDSSEPETAGRCVRGSGEAAVGVQQSRWSINP